jgi:uncharacterized protein (DUF4415 family)
MSKVITIPGDAEAWESGALGKSGAHVKKASKELEGRIDEALGLHMISIRLPRAVIETYKQLAKIHGVGYQPLMRDALCRFADDEMKKLLIGVVESQRQRKLKAKTPTSNQRVAVETKPRMMKKAA